MTTPSLSPTPVGVLGLGFMGRTHAAAYLQAAADGLAVHLAALADPDPAKLTGQPASDGNITSANAPLWNPATLATYTNATDLFASNAQLVSICTHTDSHVELALAALAAGKHILIEKPVSLAPDEINRLDQAARHANRHCIPAMCMRFWPGWSQLYALIHTPQPALGRLRSISFQRLGSNPKWGGGFYQDDTRSGGVLFDLHIHDIDFAHFLFGAPASLNATGDARHVSTQLYYDNPAGPVHVVAEAAWDQAPAAGFTMRYVANFEHATVDFDLARAAPAMIHTKETSKPLLETPPVLTGYDLQARAAIGRIRTEVNITQQAAQGQPASSSGPPPTLAAARAVTFTLQAIRASQKSRTYQTPLAQ